MESFPLRDAERARIAGLLEQRAILPTAQRTEIAAIVLAEPQHLSAEQVFAKSRAAGLSVSKATIYNTLGLLVDKGLVRQVIVDSSRVFYDSNVEQHHHFYNVDDGVLMDIPPLLIPAEGFPVPPKGTQTEGVDIVIRVRNKA